MTIERVRAVVIGLLFMVATAMGILNAAMIGPLIGAEDFLAEVSGRAGTIGLGTLLNTIMAFSVTAIAVAIYPVLKITHETLAIGYLAARMIEGTILAVAGLTWQALLPASAELVQTTADRGHQLVADTLVTIGTIGFTLAAEIAFGISALILNSVLLRASLVPRFISIWGLVAGGLILVLGGMKILGLPIDLVEIPFTAPIALNEMVLAVWLIAHGFSGPTGLNSISGRFRGRRSTK